MPQLAAPRSPLTAGAEEGVRGGRMVGREQPGRGEHVVEVDDRRGCSRELPAAPTWSPVPSRAPGRDVGRVVAQHPAGAHQQVHLAQVLAAALDDPAVGAAHLRRPACRRSATPTAAAATRSSSSRSSARRRAGTPGRPAVPPRRPAAARCPRAARAATPSSTVGTALQRIPRSPSTVRLTGRVATTSRASPASSGSVSTTECTSVVAPPTSTTTTSPAPGCSASRPWASSSTAVSTTSGVAPRTIAVKSARFERCLPPITCRRNVSRIAARADPGASTPMRGTTLPASTYGVPARRRAPRPRRGPRRCRPPRRAAPAGPRQGGRTAQQHLGVAAVGAADEQHARPAGLAPASAGRRGSARRWTTCTTRPPLDSATRRPASAVTSSSLPTTAIRSPPPADEQASTSASSARGSTRASSARHASQPSSTSVSRVVGWLAEATRSARGQVDERRLGERRPEVDAARPAGHSPTGRGRGRRAGRRRSRCRPRAGSGPRAPRGRCRPREAWVIRPGCSISDSTPPSDSARVNTSARGAHVQRLLLAARDPERDDAAVPLHLPGWPPRARGARRARGRSPARHAGWPARNSTTFSALSQCRSIRTAERLEPAQRRARRRTGRRPRRWRSGGSRPLGERRGRGRRARRRRRRSGRRSTSSWSARRRRRPATAAAGGTATRRCCRRRAARRRRARPPASASMSPMLSSGLVGVSTQTILVSPGRIAARTASTSETGRGVREPPRLLDLGEQPVVPPYASSGMTTWSPGAQRPEQGVLGGEAAGEREAPLPLLQRRDVASSAVRVGLASGSTRSRRASRRRRPACRCWSRRWAGSPRRSWGRARSRRGSHASRSRTSGCAQRTAERTARVMVDEPSPREGSSSPARCRD